MSEFIKFWTSCLFEGWHFGDSFLGIAAIASLLIAYFFLRHKGKEKQLENWEKFLRKFCFWGFLSCLIFSTFLLTPFQRFQEEKEKSDKMEKAEQDSAAEDYVYENRAYLEAQLVIDAISNNLVYDHYEIHNTGKLPATSIIESERLSSGAIECNSDDIGNRDLSPSAQMSSKFIPEYVFDNQSEFNPHLMVNYQTKVHGTNMNFSAEYDFDIAPGEMKTGVFTYDHSELDKSKIVNVYQSFKDALGSLNGTIVFTLPEYGLDTSPNVVEISSGNRYFTYNGRTSEVVFQSPLSDGSNYVRSVRIGAHAGSEWNVFALKWTTNDAHLWINSVEIP